MRGSNPSTRLALLSLLAGLPAVVVAVATLRVLDLSGAAQAAIAISVVASWLGLWHLAHRRWRFHLRTLSNLVAALREGDYSFRVRGGHRGDAHSEVICELNTLAETMRSQRVGEAEAGALLQKVLAGIDVAVFAFDQGNRLQLVNRTGERLLAADAASLHGRAADELGLSECLTGPTARTLNLDLGPEQARGQWEMRRGGFRLHGRPQQLLILSDVSRALRAEQLQAWKRLIRVIGHELNNSLAPITSLAASLQRLVTLEPPPEDWRDDLLRGLGVIQARAEALHRFMDAYSGLAKMPQPRPRLMLLADCVRRVVGLEHRLPIQITGGPEVTLNADQDQLEQLLINLVQNAVDASLEQGGEVTIGWGVEDGHVQLEVADRGPGLANTHDLFVPFYTTKTEGSGIGLFLCRQIAEAHGGSVTLENRADGDGCVARLRLPLGEVSESTGDRGRETTGDGRRAGSATTVT